MSVLFSGATEGCVRVSATAPVHALVYGEGAPEFSALPALDPADGALERLCAHYACGAGFETWVWLVNPGDAALGVTLRGVPDVEDGAGRPVHAVSVPARAARRVTVSEAFGAGGEALKSGFIRLESDASKGGLLCAVAIRHAAGGVTCLPAWDLPVREARFSHVAHGMGYVTGVTLVNPTTRPAHVQMQLCDGDAQPVGQCALDLPPGARQAHLVNEFFGVSERLGGSIRVSASEPLHLYEIFGRGAGDLFAAVPPLPEPGDVPPATGECAEGPQFLAADPLSGGPGATVNLWGWNFGKTPGENRVTLGGAEMTVTAASSHVLRATVPATAVSGPLAVRVGVCDAFGPHFDVTGPALGVVITSPANGAVLASPDLTVTGTVAGPVTGVRVNGLPATLNGSGWTASLRVPPGPTEIRAEATSPAATAEDRVTVHYRPVPVVEITTPADGALLGQAAVTVTGTVHNGVTENAAVPGVSASSGKPAASVSPGVPGASGAPVSPGSPAASGDTTGITSVTVNGLPAALDAQGNFTLASLPLVEGPNTVTARAETAWATAADHTHTVTVDTALWIRIDTPAECARVTELPLTVSGKCAVGVESVDVNGIRADLTPDSDGFAFTLPMALPEGPCGAAYPGRNLTARGHRGTETVEASVPVGVDTTGPSVSLQADPCGWPGRPVHLTLVVSDTVAVDAVALTVNGQAVDLPPAASRVDPGYWVRWDLDWTVPEGPPATLQWRLAARDAVPGRPEAVATAVTQVLDPRDNGAFVLGRVFRAHDGLPLDDAGVTLLATGKTVRSDAQGEYVLPAVPGPVELRVQRDGYLDACRFAQAADGTGTAVLDARLTPVDPKTTPVSAGGGAAVDSTRALTLQVPAGALAVQTDLRLTAVAPQGLPQVLPTGWTPWVALDLAPATVAFALPARLETAWGGAPPDGRPWAWLRFDPAQRRWVRREAPNASLGETAWAVDVHLGGSYVLAVADPAPLTPAVPAVGEALLPGDPPGPAAALTAEGEVLPAALAAGTGMVALADLRVTSAAPVASGTAVTAAFRNTWRLSGGGDVEGRAYAQDLLLFRGPGAPDGGLRATFPVRPVEEFDPVDLLSGRVTVDVLPERSRRVGTILQDPATTLENDRGDRVTLGGAGLPAGVWVDFRALASWELPDSGSDDLDVLGGFRLASLAPLPDGTAVAVVCPVPAGEALAFYRLLRGPSFGGEGSTGVSGGTAVFLVYACPAVRQGDTVVSLPTLSDNSPAPGLARGGDFVLCRLAHEPVFAEGTVDLGGAHPAGVRVTSSTCPVVSDLDAANRYFLQTFPADEGTVRLRGADDAAGYAGEADALWPGTIRVTRDLALAPVVPVVVATWPGPLATGLSGVTEALFRFDAPLYPTTVSDADAGVTVDGAPIAAAVRVSLRNAGRDLVVTPAAGFPAGSVCEVRVGPAVSNRYGRPMAAPAVLHFETAPASTVPVGIPGLAVSVDVTGATLTLTSPGCPIPPGGKLKVVNLTTGETRILTACPGGGAFSLTVGGTPWDDIRILVEDAFGAVTTVPLPVMTDADGGHFVGPAGGVVTGAGGVRLEIPAGALPVRARIKAILEGPDAPHEPLPDGFPFWGKLSVESTYRQQTSKEIRVSWPAPSGMAEDTSLIYLRTIELDSGPTYSIQGLARMQGGTVFHLTNQDLDSAMTANNAGSVCKVLPSSFHPGFCGTFELFTTIAYCGFVPNSTALITGTVKKPRWDAQLIAEIQDPVPNALVAAGTNVYGNQIVTQTNLLGEYGLILLNPPNPVSAIEISALEPATGMRAHTWAVEIEGYFPPWLYNFGTCLFVGNLVIGDLSLPETPVTIQPIRGEIGVQNADIFTRDELATLELNVERVLNPVSGKKFRFKTIVSPLDAEMEVFLDGGPMVFLPPGENSTTLYTVPLDTQELFSGSHELTIVARKGNGTPVSESFHFVVFDDILDVPPPVPGESPIVLSTIPEKGSSDTSCLIHPTVLFSEPVLLPAGDSFLQLKKMSPGGDEESVPCALYPGGTFQLPGSSEIYHTRIVMAPKSVDPEHPCQLDPGTRYAIRWENIPPGIVDTDGSSLVLDESELTRFDTFTPQGLCDQQSYLRPHQAICKVGQYVFLLREGNQPGLPMQRSALQIWDYKDIGAPRKLAEIAIPLNAMDFDVQPIYNGFRAIVVCAAGGTFPLNSVLLIYDLVDANSLSITWDEAFVYDGARSSCTGAVTLAFPGTGGTPLRVRRVENMVYVAVAGLGVRSFVLSQAVELFLLSQLIKDIASAEESPISGIDLSPMGLALLPQYGFCWELGGVKSTQGQCFDLDVMDWPASYAGNALPRQVRLVGVADGTFTAPKSVGSSTLLSGRITLYEDPSESVPGTSLLDDLHLAVDNVLSIRQVLVLPEVTYYSPSGSMGFSPLLLATGIRPDGGSSLMVYGLSASAGGLSVGLLGRKDFSPSEGPLVLGRAGEGAMLSGSGKLYRLLLDDFRKDFTQRILVANAEAVRFVCDDQVVYLAFEGTAPGGTPSGGQSAPTVSGSRIIVMDAVLQMMGVLRNLYDDRTGALVQQYDNVLPVIHNYVPGSSEVTSLRIPAGVLSHYLVLPPDLLGSPLDGDGSRLNETVEVLSGSETMTFERHENGDGRIRRVKTTQIDLSLGSQDDDMPPGCNGVARRREPPRATARAKMRLPGGMTLSSSSEETTLLELIRLHSPVVNIVKEAVPQGFFKGQDEAESCPKLERIGFFANFNVRVKTLRILDQNGLNLSLRQSWDLSQFVPTYKNYYIEKQEILEYLAELPVGRYVFAFDVEALDFPSPGNPGQYVVDVIYGNLFVGWDSHRSQDAEKVYWKSVDLREGHRIESATDLGFEDRGLSLQFTRTWYSGGQHPRYGILGDGWGHSLDISLQRDECGDLLVNGGDAAGLRFRKVGTVWMPQRGDCATLFEDDDDYTLITKQGLKYRFENYLGKANPWEWRLKSQTDPDGNQLSWVYEPSFPRQIREIHHTSGNRMVFEYECRALGRRIKRVLLLDPEGREGNRAEYDYGLCGTLDRVTVGPPPGKAGTPKVIDYIYTVPASPQPVDDIHLLSRVLGPNPGNVAETYYQEEPPAADQPGRRIFRVVSVRDGDQPSPTEFQYAPGKTTVKDPKGFLTEYRFDNRGSLVTTIRLSDNAITAYEWYAFDSAGHPVMNKKSETRPDGSRSDYQYDNRGNVIQQVENPTEGDVTAVWTWEWDPVYNRKVYEKSPLGIERRWELDARGHVVRDTESAMVGDTRETHETIYEYDQGNLISSTDTLGRKTKYAGYDVHGRAAVEIDPLGRVEEKTWSHWGELLVEKGPTGAIKRTSYDGMHRPVEIQVGNGLTGELAVSMVESLSYHPGGQICLRRQTDGNGLGVLEERIHLDALSRVARKETSFSPSWHGGGAWFETFGYDLNGNLERHVDPSGKVHLRTFNAQNLELTHDVDGKRVSVNEYDVRGRKTLERDEYGRRTIYVYDGFGRKSWEVGSAPGPNDALPFPVAGAPPAAENRFASGKGFNLEGWVLWETDETGAKTIHEYDGFGRRTRTIDPLGNSATWKFDRKGNPIEERDEVRGLVTSFTYDALDRPKSKVVSASGRAVGESSGGFIYRWTYAYLDLPGGGFKTLETEASTGTTRETLTDGLGKVCLEAMQDTQGSRIEKSTRWNAFGGVVEEKDAEGRIRTWLRTPQGFAVRETDASGFRLEKAFNPDGTVREQRAEQSKTPERWISRRFTYDALGRKKTEELLREVSGSSAWSQEHFFEYAEFSSLDDPAAVISDGTTGVWWKDTDVLGRTTFHFEDGSGRDVLVLHPENTFCHECWEEYRQERFGYDGEGREVYHRRKDGWVDRTRYDGLGRLTEFQEAVEAEDDSPKRQTEAERSRFSGNAGKPQRVEYADPMNARTEYDRAGNATRVLLDPLGREVLRNRLAVRVSHADGGPWVGDVRMARREYDQSNRVVLEVDADGRATRNTYDGFGRLVKQEDGLKEVSDGSVEETGAYCLRAYTYDRVGNRLTETDCGMSGSPRWVYGYNERNERVSTTDALGNMTSASYDGLGQEVLRRSPLGRETRFEYDEKGDLVKVTLDAGGPTAGTWTFERDAAGRLLRRIDPENRFLEQEWDPWDRLVLKRFQDGASQTSEWNYAYDALGNLVRALDPEGVEEKRTFDKWGRLKAVELPEAVLASLGPVQGVPVALSPGRSAGEIPDVPVRTDYAYDQNDNVLEIKEEKLCRADASGYGAGQVIGDWGTWKRVRFTSFFAYDGLQRLESRREGYGGARTGFAHDRSGNRAGIGYPGEDWTANWQPSVSYTRNAAGRLTDISRRQSPEGSPWEAHYDYYPQGWLKTVVYPNGVRTEIAYDPVGRITSIDTTRTTDGLKVSRFEYDYDADGNKTAMREWNAVPACRSAGWDAAPQTTAYTYDGQGRLTGVDYPDGRHAAYTYDGAGNRLTEEETVPVAGGGVRVVKQRSFACDGRNRLVTVRDALTPGRSVRYVHNRRGEVVSRLTGELDGSGEILPGTETGRLSLTWDAAGRLRRVVKETAGALPVTLAEYSYDASGRRVWKAGLSLPGPRRYVWDGTELLAELEGLGSAPAVRRLRVYGEGLVAEETVGAGGASRFCHDDARGSAVNRTSAAGIVVSGRLYDAWGNFRQLEAGGVCEETPGLDPGGLWSWEAYLADLAGAYASDEDRTGFDGSELEPESGLYYAGSRYYEPETGRFLSTDPEPGTERMPLTQHGYLYGVDNPATYGEEDGRQESMFGGDGTLRMRAFLGLMRGDASHLEKALRDVAQKPETIEGPKGAILRNPGGAYQRFETAMSFLGDDHYTYGREAAAQHDQFAAGRLSGAEYRSAALSGDVFQMTLSGAGRGAPLAFGLAKYSGKGLKAGYKAFHGSSLARRMRQLARGADHVGDPAGRMLRKGRGYQGYYARRSTAVRKPPPTVVRHPATVEPGTSTGLPRKLDDAAEAADDVSPATVPPNDAPNGGICFAAGTEISTPYGTKKIESVCQGDTVYAFDFETSGVVERKVLETIRNFTYFWVDIQVGEEIIRATRGHLFWVDSEQRWVEAAFLKTGMTLRLIDGFSRQVKSLVIRELDCPEATYNFVAEEKHNYFVGSVGILVHNGGHGDWHTSPWWQTDPHTVYQGEDGYIGLTDDFLRRQAEWDREGRKVFPLHEDIPGRLAGRGVEQSEIEAAKARGEAVPLKQHHSIRPARTDPKAIEMRARGQEYLKSKLGGC
ncbi:MAG: IPT/TIG domain-containing protein [Acidobacteria bacterium]|nr:IPT/TIG domain-containing protein [Acidobacteriota bacterium]